MNFSKIDTIVAELGLNVADGLQIIEAKRLAGQYYPQLEPTLPLLITNLQSASVDEEPIAKRLARTLMNCYPAAHEVVSIYRAPESRIEQHITTLNNLSAPAKRAIEDHLFVPALEAGRSFTALLDIVAHLRAPNGCPWDREQTLATLRHDLLDEAAEVLEAIDAEQNGLDNTLHIVEELGDLLLLPAMMTQIAVEGARFQMADVTYGIVEKLIRRHPHVFGNVNTDDIDQIVVNWDAIKAQEKAERGEVPRGPLDGIPASLPALEKARKIQSKAKKAGLLDREALAHSANQRWMTLQQQAQSGDTNESELGAFLWSLVALAHENGLNSENALRSQVGKFREQVA